MGHLTAAHASSAPEGHANGGLPETLAEFLSALVERRPQLEISLLLWDYAVLYAAERGLVPTYTLRWNTPPNIKLCLDEPGANWLLAAPRNWWSLTTPSPSQVGSTSPCGAGTLRITAPTTRSAGILPSGPDEPFHDVQMLLDGEAARALAAL